VLPPLFTKSLRFLPHQVRRRGAIPLHLSTACFSVAAYLKILFDSTFFRCAALRCIHNSYPCASHQPATLCKPSPLLLFLVIAFSIAVFSCLRVYHQVTLLSRVSFIEETFDKKSEIFFYIEKLTSPDSSVVYPTSPPSGCQHSGKSAPEESAK